MTIHLCDGIDVFHYLFDHDLSRTGRRTSLANNKAVVLTLQTATEILDVSIEFQTERKAPLTIFKMRVYV